MKVRKYEIKIFYYLEAVDYMCCERIVTYRELIRIIESIEEALALNIRVEYRVTHYYEDSVLDALYKDKEDD